MTDNSNNSTHNEGNDKNSSAKNPAQYKAVWEEAAKKDIKKLSKPVAKAMIVKIQTYLILAPYELGKPLTAKWNGYRSFRYDDYRIIYRVVESNRTIIIIKVGHRSDVY